MAKEINLEIITPQKQAFFGVVLSVTIPGTVGNFQVLFNHAPILSSFEVGQLKLVNPKGEITVFATSGGTVEVLDNKILVLAETLEKPEEINIERAEEAQDRANERLHRDDRKDVDVLRAEFALQRALNRLKVAKKFSD